ncbi:MAG: DNA-processing protein DprA [Mariprofundus sp.]|nr:DNA-processing protein DprA [Mariprofundus sp.]
MRSDKALAWLRLAMVRGIGPMTGRRLVQAVGGIEKLYSLPIRELQAMDGIGPAVSSALEQNLDQAVASVVEVCEQRGIGLLCPDDSAWPATLYPYDDAPLLLFFQGETSSMHDSRMLAVVGARRASRESSLITRRWCSYLSNRDVCIVSGMAYGIDAAAHGGALEGESPTIAILGCGLAALSAQQQRQTQAIAARGCVLSEFLPRISARPEHFPRRNRIIASLSHATLVMEADVRSGSLITARNAIDYGREVFAVPGSVLGGNHAGCHQLIREGAVLAESADDVLKNMGWEQAGKRTSTGGKAYQPSDAAESRLLQALATESMHLDHLAETCGLTVPELSPIVLRLELQGIIERLPGSRYLLSVELHRT